MRFHVFLRPLVLFVLLVFVCLQCDQSCNLCVSSFLFLFLMLISGKQVYEENLIHTALGM
jgi:hypothetical protein